MASSELTIQYPESLERAMRVTKVEMEHHLRLMAALKMFELGNITSGMAAELAGMSRIDFFEACGRYHVSILNYPEDEIDNQLGTDMEVVNKVKRQ